MATLKQETWNTLFGWMQEGQCMIPEGCRIPAGGALFYSILLLLVLAVTRLYVIDAIDKLWEWWENR